MAASRFARKELVEIAKKSGTLLRNLQAEGRLPTNIPALERDIEWWRQKERHRRKASAT